MIRYIAMISLCCFCIGLLTFNVERVETVKVNEWDLEQEVQDSIQYFEEVGYKAYADSIFWAYIMLPEEKKKQVNIVMRVCQVISHQNDNKSNLLNHGIPKRCGCLNTTYYE